MDIKNGSARGNGEAKTPKANGTPDGEQSSSGAKHTGSTGSRGWPKGKRRYPKAPGAPKQPLSG